MRTVTEEYRFFAAGFVAGLALSGVVRLTAGAVRRTAACLRRHAGPEPRVSFIDGVHAPNEVELDARPQEEANLAPQRLVSEAIDVSPSTQRW